MPTGDNPTPVKTSTSTLSARVEWPGEKPFEGRVVATDHNLATLEFLRKSAPILPIGCQVGLSVFGPDLAEPLVVRGRVAHRRDFDETITYQFQFAPQDGEALNAIFKRRTASRIRPDEVIAVQVAIAGGTPAPALNSVLNDISRTGVSITIGTPAEARLCNATHLMLSFHLPGINGPIELAGRIRYRRLTGTTIRYGLEFAPQGRADHEKQVARVGDYMTKRKHDVVKQTLAARAVA